jgi:hypothetical protein
MDLLEDVPNVGVHEREELCRVGGGRGPRCVVYIAGFFSVFFIYLFNFIIFFNRLLLFFFLFFVNPSFFFDSFHIVNSMEQSIMKVKNLLLCPHILLYFFFGMLVLFIYFLLHLPSKKNIYENKNYYLSFRILTSY